MPLFTQRHHSAIAKAFQNIHPGDDASTEDFDARLEMWHDIKNAVALVFTLDSGRFSDGRFRVECLPNMSGHKGRPEAPDTAPDGSPASDSSSEV